MSRLHISSCIGPVSEVVAVMSVARAMSIGTEVVGLVIDKSIVGGCMLKGYLYPYSCITAMDYSLVSLIG